PGDALVLEEAVGAQREPAPRAGRPAELHVGGQLVEAVVLAEGGAVVGGLEQRAVVVVVGEVAARSVVAERGVAVEQPPAEAVAEAGAAGGERAHARRGAPRRRPRSAAPLAGD